MPRKAGKTRQTPGKALRAAVLDQYELEPHEQVILDSAARTADLVEDLQAVVDAEGVMVDGKPHPAAVELRMQRLTLGRLIASLRIPVETKHLPSRSARGFYGPRGVA